MKGTALLIGEDRTVKVLEGVNHEEYEQMASQEHLKDFQCKINEKEIDFKAVSEVVWHEDSIDWAYGY